MTIGGDGGGDTKRSVVSFVHAGPGSGRGAGAMDPSAGLRVREHGESGSTVIVLHGGPAAVGSATPIARGLADSFRVLEPWQRGSGGEPLSVGRHVADLHELIASRCVGGRPALVGESWGAMLVLAYSAAHPDAAGPLVLVGCGTFDPATRRRFEGNLEYRMDDELRGRLARLEDEIGDPEQRLRTKYDLIKPLYDYDPIPANGRDDDAAPFDVRAHDETWRDMLRLQEEGVYPAAFAAIESPVLMLHGDYDPHPGQLIRASLAPHLPQLEYHELQRCGHSPWFERHARDEFFEILKEWLTSRRIGGTR